MGVQTILVCSKFSANCTKLLDSLQKLNIDLQPLIKLVWIDHPNIRNMISESNKIRTVPSIIVHDDERDVSVVYEGQKFTDYMNTFIHNHQTKPDPRASFTAAQQHHATSHQMMQNTMKQSRFDLAYHQVNNPYLDKEKQPEIHQVLRSNINNAVFGQQTPEVFRSQGAQFLQGIDNINSQKGAKAEEQKAQAEVQRHVEYQQRLEKELQKNEIHQAMADEEKKAKLATIDVEFAHKKAESVERERIVVLEQIKSEEMTKHLPHSEQLNILEHRMLDYEIVKNDRTRTAIHHSMQTKKQNPHLAHLVLSDLHNQSQRVEEERRSILQKKQALPPIVNQKQEEHIQYREQMAKNQLHQIQRNTENSPQFKLIGDKYAVHKEMEAVQKYLEANPHSDEAKTKMEQLVFMYQEVDKQIKDMQKLAFPQPPETKKETFEPSIPKGADSLVLQQTKHQQQVDLYKVQERQNKPEGVTALDDLNEEESLYDQQQRAHKPEQRRPVGTDIRQSEAQIDASLQSSKRNSINQRIREMSNNREVRPPKGIGHENMLKSSLTVVEQPTEERPSVTSLSDLGMDVDAPNPFGTFTSMGEDMIDGDMQEEEVQAPAAIKKKSSIIDRAKELEKGRT